MDDRHVAVEVGSDLVEEAAAVEVMGLIGGRNPTVPCEKGRLKRRPS